MFMLGNYSNFCVWFIQNIIITTSFSVIDAIKKCYKSYLAHGIVLTVVLKSLEEILNIRRPLQI